MAETPTGPVAKRPSYAKAVIIGVLIALAGVAVYAAVLQSGGNKVNASSSQAACADAACGWRGPLSVRPGEPYPPKCPKCGKQLALPLSTCKKCGSKQILNELLTQWVPGNEGLPAETKCTQCGGPIVHGD